MVDDPYSIDVYRWWHLSVPSPELLAAESDGWIGMPGVVIDLGCGLGTEISHLSAVGWRALGIDRSAVAIGRGSEIHDGSQLLVGDVRRLPLGDNVSDLVLDRGCFHYLHSKDRMQYESEVWRILGSGGRFLLRACLNNAGARNDIDEQTILRVFDRWTIDALDRVDLLSDTRAMPGLVARLRRR
jgi:SAM-dependent methyltransferase